MNENNVSELEELLSKIRTEVVAKLRDKQGEQYLLEQIVRYATDEVSEMKQHRETLGAYYDLAIKFQDYIKNNNRKEV